MGKSPDEQPFLAAYKLQLASANSRTTPFCGGFNSLHIGSLGDLVFPEGRRNTVRKIYHFWKWVLDNSIEKSYLLELYNYVMCIFRNMEIFTVTDWKYLIFSMFFFKGTLSHSKNFSYAEDLAPWTLLHRSKSFFCIPWPLKKLKNDPPS